MSLFKYLLLNQMDSSLVKVLLKSFLIISKVRRIEIMNSTNKNFSVLIKPRIIPSASNNFIKKIYAEFTSGAKKKTREVL